MAEPETVDQVRERAREEYRRQLSLHPWLNDPARADDLAEMERVFTGFLPHFDAWIHDTRLRNVPVGTVRATGVMVLSNALDVLVRNTTVNDPHARATARRKLHKLILDNLKPGP